MKRYDACDLSELLEKEYGREFNVPYSIMEDQRRIEIYVDAEQADQAVIDEFKNKGYQANHLNNVFETLVNDLCFRNKLEAGEYLLIFDD